MIRPLLHKALLLALVCLAASAHADPRTATLVRVVAPATGTAFAAAVPAPDATVFDFNKGLRDLLRGPCEALRESQVRRFRGVRSPGPSALPRLPYPGIRMARLDPTPHAFD